MYSSVFQSMATFPNDCFHTATATYLRIVITEVRPCIRFNIIFSCCYLGVPVTLQGRDNRRVQSVLTHGDPLCSSEDTQTDGSSRPGELLYLSV